MAHPVAANKTLDARAKQQNNKIPIGVDIEQPKQYLTIEIPCDDSPVTLLAIGEIVEYVSARLRALGVDPVRTKFHSASDIEAI
jgi:hypothetical protein